MSAAPSFVRQISDPIARTMARFMAKVSKGDGSSCWEWTAGKNKDGYGMFQFRGLDGAANPRKESAPRVAYMLSVGPIPDGLLVRHKCDNPSCVNHDHLELGTQADNVADRVARGRSATGVGAHNRKHKIVSVRAPKQTERTYEWRGAERSVTEIAVETGVNRYTIIRRLNGGWPLLRAATENVVPAVDWLRANAASFVLPTTIERIADAGGTTVSAVSQCINTLISEWHFRRVARGIYIHASVLSMTPEAAIEAIRPGMSVAAHAVRLGIDGRTLAKRLRAAGVLRVELGGETRLLIDVVDAALVPRGSSIATQAARVGMPRNALSLKLRAAGVTTGAKGVKIMLEDAVVDEALKRVS